MNLGRSLTKCQNIKIKYISLFQEQKVRKLIQKIKSFIITSKCIKYLVI